MLVFIPCNVLFKKNLAYICVRSIDKVLMGFRARGMNRGRNWSWISPYHGPFLLGLRVTSLLWIVPEKKMPSCQAPQKCCVVWRRRTSFPAMWRYGRGGIQTHAREETGALNHRLRPLGGWYSVPNIILQQSRTGNVNKCFSAFCLRSKPRERDRGDPNGRLRRMRCGNRPGINLESLRPYWSRCGSPLTIVELASRWWHMPDLCCQRPW
jgi:hypothetical protein